MRPIKFRGCVPDSDKIDGGRIVYGSLVDHGESKYSYRYWIYPLEGERNYPVEPDSIAQLVGYDKNGNEVYEGDTLIDDDGAEFIAQLQGVVRWETDDMPDHLKTVPFDFAQQHTPLTLKERTP